MRTLGEGWHAPSVVVERVEVSRSTVYKILSGLAEDGKLRCTGNRRSLRYALLAETKAPVIPPSERNGRPSGAETNGHGTLEGRVLAWLQVNPNSSGPAIGIAVETPLNDLRPVLGKLMREGDVRTGHKNGETVYHFVG